MQFEETINCIHYIIYTFIMVDMHVPIYHLIGLGSLASLMSLKFYRHLNMLSRHYFYCVKIREVSLA